MSWFSGWCVAHGEALWTFILALYRNTRDAHEYIMSALSSEVSKMIVFFPWVGWWWYSGRPARFVAAVSHSEMFVEKVLRDVMNESYSG